MIANTVQCKAMQDEQHVLQQAETLARQNQWQEAVVLLREHQQTYPVSAKMLGLLAYCCSRASDYDSAIALYQDLQRQQPFEAKWCYALGFQYQQKAQWSDAIAAYEQSLSLAPRWLLPILRLGDTYQQVGQPGQALEMYRTGMQYYQGFAEERRNKLTPVYARLCAQAAHVLLDKPHRSPRECEEAVQLLQESVEIASQSADNWYRLGSALLDSDRVNEALDCLHKAESLAPKKEYIPHKIAQVYLKKGNPDKALQAYERIPQHRRVPYVLHGMAQCFMAKEEMLEAAKKLYQAIRREPRKFYHHWDFALSLISLGAKEQAIEALEQANRLFQQEYGQDYRKALTKLDEVRSTLADGKRIAFDEPSSAKSESRFGTVAKYDTRRGFGFIRDDADGASVFFHITRVKGQVSPPTGSRVRYMREVGEKGFQAAQVWL